MHNYRYFLMLLCSAITVFYTPISTAQTEGSNQPLSTLNEEDADIRYISDDLFIYMRAGPGTNYRLVGTITSGAKIKVLKIEHNTGFAEITDERQRTGWVEVQFISRTPSVKYEVIELRASSTEKTKKLAMMEQQVSTVMQNLSKSDTQKHQLNRQVTQQLEDIAKLNEHIETRDRNNSMQWFTRGAILALVSLIIGYILGLIQRKKRNSNHLM